MRNQALADAKSTLRQWFRGQPDDYLIRVVAEIRDGVFAYSVRCHCLKGLCRGGYDGVLARSPLAERAEEALRILKWGDPEMSWLTSDIVYTQEGVTRRRTLPIVLAEIRRRNRTAIQARAECTEWTHERQ